MFSSLPSPAVSQTTSSAHISACLHNLFWWRMRTRCAATWINGIRLPQINRYNYRCSRNELYLQLARGTSLQSLHTDRTCPLPDRFTRTSGKFGSPSFSLPPMLVFHLNQTSIMTFPSVIIVDSQSSCKFS